MANRRAPALHPNGAGAELFHAAQAAIAAGRDALPPRSEGLRRVIDAFALGENIPTQTRPADLVTALRQLRQAVFTVAGYETQCSSLWREAVATGWIAAAIARHRRASPGTAGVAGLLHRAGEALALAAVARSESAAALLIDPGIRTQLCDDHGPELTQALARAWRLAAPVGAALQGWRRVGEGSGISADAKVVYFAHALATQSLFTDFRAPGLESAMAEGLELTSRSFATLQLSLEPIREAAARLKV